MNAEGIKLLFDYNYWANERILTAAARVSAGQYAAMTDLGIGFKSLRGTLIHLLDGERQWRITCQGYYERPLTAREYGATELTEAQFATLDALRKGWQDEERQMRAYVGKLSDAELNSVLRYTIPGGIVRERVLWHCLLHLVNHGTQHRSEAAAVLTMYGQSPGELDFTLYLNERFHLPFG